MQDLTLTLIQSELAWENPPLNLKYFDKKIKNIEEPGDLIILPEMFTTGFTMNARAHAEEMDGRSMEWMAETAAKKQTTICGSIIIKEKGHYFNRLIWMPADGQYAYYDKKHLFRMGDEHLHYTAGEKKLIVELKGWKIMPLICYDLRFPVWSKNSFTEGEYGFDLLIYLANWPALRSEAWTTLIRARAIENMAYAAGVNRTGRDGRDYLYTGDSLIAAPDGSKLLQIEPKRESVETQTLKADFLVELRKKLGVGNDWDSFDLI